MQRIAKRVVDVILTAMLLCLMAYQVTGNAIHEWVGIAMLAIVIVHQVLNRKWYGSLIKGRYRAYRIVMTALDVLVLAAFALDTFTGMAISYTAVHFLLGMIPLATARMLHRGVSYWVFALMGVHLGFHFPVLASGLSKTTKRILLIMLIVIAVTGLFLFLDSDMPNYMLFAGRFKRLDLGGTGPIVFLKYIAMLLAWALLGTGIALLFKRKNDEGENNNRRFTMNAAAEKETDAKKTKLLALEALIGVGEGALSHLSDEELKAIGMGRYESSPN